MTLCDNMDYKMDEFGASAHDAEVDLNHTISRKHGTVADQQDMARMGKKQEMNVSFPLEE